MSECFKIVTRCFGLYDDRDSGWETLGDGFYGKIKISHPPEAIEMIKIVEVEVHSRLVSIELPYCTKCGLFVKGEGK